MLEMLYETLVTFVNYTTPHKFVLMYITIVSLKSNVMWFGLVQLNELCEVFYNVDFRMLNANK